MANTVESSKTPENLDKFYDDHSKYVWVVRLERPKSNPPFIYLTAFSCSDDTLVSISGPYSLSSKRKIWARRCHEADFIHELEVVKVDESLYITLLKIKNGPVNGRYGIFSKDGSFKGNENIYGISNVAGFDGTFHDGRVASSIPEFDSIPNLSDSSTCGDYRFNSYEDPLPPYRIMGRVFNVGSLKAGDNCMVFEKGLNPHIPLLECLDFGPVGAGGPVLNYKGEIVGMFIKRAELIGLAIHVSVLRTFVKSYFDQRRKESPKRERDRVKEERENKKRKV